MLEAVTEKVRGSLSSDDALGQNESLLSEHSRDAPYNRPKKRTRHLCPWVSGVIALIVSNILTATLCFAYFKHGNHLLKWTSAYSPVLDQLDIARSLRNLHIPLIPNATDPRDIYRLPPSPAVDEAWDRITRVNLISVSEDEVRGLGKDPSLAIRAPESWWSGSWGDGYLGQIDVFHQIHCLNMLRQGLVTNYNYYWGRRYGLAPPLAFGMHLNHCLGTLLENLMCHADVDVVTFNWREGQPDPFPDFAVAKQCRDFDAVARWQRERQVGDVIDRWKALEKPPGAKQRQMPPGLADVDPKGDGEVDGVRVLRLADLPAECQAKAKAEA
ncbi:putative tat pathway signal sequence protein [Rosellinia necatrix]|uniref:Putative tat pathway signal sequence protein n=1 Tax=Rosellinia necatrix TaxID=77044 RepID=A0A1W2TB59_ROSNE|nr:putative tat pathway signal sequence protein [Rosellinia necatrix]